MTPTLSFLSMKAPSFEILQHSEAPKGPFSPRSFSVTIEHGKPADVENHRVEPCRARRSHDHGSEGSQGRRLLRSRGKEALLPEALRRREHQALLSDHSGPGKLRLAPGRGCLRHR